MPTTVGIAKYTLLPENTNIYSTEASNGRGFRRNGGGHIWNLSVYWPELTRDERAELMNFFNKQRGIFDSFQVGFPDDKTARGVATGTPLVNGAHAAGLTAIVTDGWTVSQTGILKEDDLKTFAGQNKLYRCSADANSDASGNATINIEPPLYKALTNNEVIDVTDAKLTVTLISEPELRTIAPVRYSMRADMREFI